jgi:GMP synthase (glutamine-hydrolysing)
MRLHYFQHVPFEPPGTIERWASDRGHDLTGTHLYREEAFPEIDDVDWLIVMGGPMGVGDTEEYPWLREEARFIERAIDAGRVVAGICLGAQLVAAALGADVYEARTPEIGWFPVEATPAAADSPLFADLGESYGVFHWHGDTFDLPGGATRMAGTDACRNQAFVYEERVVGLQFHLESAPETVADLLAESGDLPEGPRVQDPDRIVEGLDRAGRLEDRLRTLFDNLEAHAGCGDVDGGREDPDAGRSGSEGECGDREA